MPRAFLIVLAVVALAAAAAGARVGASEGAPDGAQAAEPSLSRAAGRRIVTGMDGTFPSRSLRARVRRGQVGGVILFGPNVGPGLGRAIAALQHAARAGGNPPLLVMVDQEGGEVKRLSGLPPSRAPARMTAATAGREG